MADRVRMNTVSLSTVALSQGVVFWHAGTDLLRSKSLDRNSYDSGDWFNRVDWQRRENTFGSGLPLRGDNEAKWAFMRPLLADPALDPGPAAMDAAHARAQDLLRIRMSSRLFRLGSLDAIQAKVSFLDAEPGVIAMLVDDTAGTDADPARDGDPGGLQRQPARRRRSAAPAPAGGCTTCRPSGTDDGRQGQHGRRRRGHRAGTHHGGLRALSVETQRTPPAAAGRGRSSWTCA